MNNALKRLARITGLLALGAVVGFAAGFNFGFDGGRKVGSFSTALTTAWAGEQAMLQYKNAGYAEARTALLGYVRVLEDATTQRVPGLPGSANLHHADIALAFTRLANLESANGKPDESARFLQRAVDEARKAGWRETTTENLRAAVEKLDSPRTAPKPSAP